MVPRLENTNVIGSKREFKIEYTEDGSTNIFKARLVVRGFTQVPGIYFDKTFSTVVKTTIIRLVIAIAVSSRLLIKQLDVH